MPTYSSAQIQSAMRAAGINASPSSQDIANANKYGLGIFAANQKRIRQQAAPTGAPVSIDMPQDPIGPTGRTVQSIGAPQTATINPVAKQIQELDAAAQRRASGTASPTDVQNLDYAAKRYGYTYQPGVGGKYTKGQPIDASQLGSNDAFAELSNTLGFQVTPDMISPEIAGLLALQGRTTKSEEQYQTVQDDLIRQMKELGGQGADLQAELDRQGVPQAFQQVKELNLRAAQLQGELENFDVSTTQGQENISGQAIPTGLIQGQQGQFQRQRDIARMGKAAELAATAALSQAYQGNAQLGSQLAQQAVDLKYQPILNNIEVLQTQLSFAGERMGREDKERAGVIGALIDAQQQKIGEQKDRENQIQSLAINIASMGAPLDVVQRVQKSSDPVRAAQIAGEWERQFNLSEEARKRGITQSTKLQPTAGFFDADTEADVRGSYAELDGQGLSGREAYSRLRSLYSVNEVSDAALKQLTGTTPLPTPQQAPVTTRSTTPSGSRFSGLVKSFNSLFSKPQGKGKNTGVFGQNSLTSSIQKSLFGK